MLIVGDSSPLISLAIINRLDLLSKLYDDYILPEEVYKEVIKEDKPYSEFLQESLKKHVRIVKDKLAAEILKKKLCSFSYSLIYLEIVHVDNRIMDDISISVKTPSCA